MFFRARKKSRAGGGLCLNCLALNVLLDSFFTKVVLVVGIGGERAGANSDNARKEIFFFFVGKSSLSCGSLSVS